MNNASGLINLARNIGASTGISFVTTMLDRRAQFHQDVLAGQLAGHESASSRRRCTRITHMMMTRGPDAVHAAMQAQGMVYQELQRQAMMLSFVDNFRTMASHLRVRDSVDAGDEGAQVESFSAEGRVAKARIAAEAQGPLRGIRIWSGGLGFSRMSRRGALPA